jgi:lipoate-protein ligase B
MAYDEALAIQRQHRDELLQGRGDDLLLTVEHSPGVLTAGRRALPGELRLDVRQLDELGVQVRDVERGGSWTWHGPGQLVAYPVVALRRRQLKVPAFVAGLEWAMAQLLERMLVRCGVDPAALGLRIGQLRGFPGTWVERADGTHAKVGAVGVHVRRFVSSHGMALNLRPEPWGFQWIVPCGLEHIETTSAARLVAEFGADAGALPTVEAAGAELAELLPACWSPQPGQGAVCLSAPGSAASPPGPAATR